MIRYLTKALLRLIRRTPKGNAFPKEGAGRIARLFYMTRLLQRMEGRSVRFVREVDRFPHFDVPKGSTGTVVGLSFSQDHKAIIRVRLDDETIGAEEFDHEVHWMEGVNLEEFEKDVVLLPN